jgi:APA family basic amino acid/polyamine antiporter
MAQPAGVSGAVLERTFAQEFASGLVPVGHGAAIPHMRVAGLPEPILLLVRCRDGLHVTTDAAGAVDPELASVRAVFFLVSPKEHPGRHLRLLGHLATRVAEPQFLTAWSHARSPSELRATLLPDERLVQLVVGWGLPTEAWIGRPLRSIELPPGTLVALVRRPEGDVVPEGATVLRAGDRLSVIGEAAGIRELAHGDLFLQRPVAGTTEGPGD